MQSTLLTIATIVIALLLFMLVIVVHELGHFLFAKLFKVKVNEFSVGMGPKLISKKKGETRYSLRLIPIGGFCAMEGEDEDSPDENAINRKKVWKRIIIITAGAVFNIILGFIFMIIIQGQQDAFASNTIGEFVPSAVSASDYMAASDSDAVYYFTTDAQLTECYEIIRNKGDKGVSGFDTVTFDEISEKLDDKEGYLIRRATSKQTGLLEGDEIYSVNGSRALCFNDAYFEMAFDEDGVMDFVVIRDGEKLELNGVHFDKDPSGTNVLDFRVYPIEKNFGTVLGQSALQSQYMIRSVYKSLFWLISGRAAFSEMSGPVGIATAIGDAAEAGYAEGFMSGLNNILYVMAIIAFNLGIVNLLPLPALDGGRLMFLIIEGIRRKPINPKYEGIVHIVGFVLLMALMVAITFQDIVKLFERCTG